MNVETPLLKLFKRVKRLLCVVVAIVGIKAAAAIQTMPASELQSYTAQLNAVVNPEPAGTYVWFEWGTSTNYSQTTPMQFIAGGVTNATFSQVITGLTIETTYQFRAVASNDIATYFGTNQSFMTRVFTEIFTEIRALYLGSAVWADFDNDGRMDLLLVGGGGPDNGIWHNTGNGFVWADPVPGIFQVNEAAVACEDFNNDGWVDFAISGQSFLPYKRIADVYRNLGDRFTNANVGIPGVLAGGLAWLDFNHDAKPDLVVTGSGNDYADIWQNKKGPFLNLQINLPASWGGTAIRGDFDNDGLPDLFLSGGGSADVWRNTGNGFTNLNVAFPDFSYSSAAWGDFDNDGRLDIVVGGITSTGQITQVWRNTGNTFTNINANLNGIRFGDVAWGDYDNDGRLDLLVENVIVKNTSNGFVRINTELPAPYETASAWGDYDNDGRLDIVESGDVYLTRTHLFHNDTPHANTPPLPPGNLSVSLSEDTAVFSWGTGSDAETPTLGLTYNLRVGTTPGGCDILSPMSASDGRRRVPQMGNVQMAHSYKLINLPLNKTIYWSVQSVDTAYAGSAFAPEGSFYIASNVSPASGPVAGDLNGDGIVDGTDVQMIANAMLVNQPPVISNFNRVSSNQFSFTSSPVTDLPFSLRTSTNFVDWELLGTATTRYLFTDTNAPANPHTFYRLQYP